MICAWIDTVLDEGLRVRHLLHSDHAMRDYIVRKISRGTVRGGGGRLFFVCVFTNSTEGFFHVFPTCVENLMFFFFLNPERGTILSI